MERSPFAASLLVLAFGIGIPIALTQRLSQGVLPLQPFDAALVVGVVVWLFISKAIIDRDSVVPALSHQRLSLRWHANSLVDQSIFGVGFDGEESATSTLHLATAPAESIEAMLPPPIHPSLADGFIREGGELALQPALPVLSSKEPDAPVILATEEYTVARRDTYWSIAEAVFDDGRHWTALQDLNLGREVAPGVMLAEGDELRIGWSILIPLVASLEDEDEQHDS